ncbi:MAG TPA: SGNH/GDSL hydrolase family protein [Anaerolineales bacterium]|nr:SGNH/GDSL hydrolase family protein [Anaerolineales bacterium]
MKRVLCYGDSNTWGYNPVTQDRFDKHERRTGQLSQTLGSNYDVIEEGLNGRTTVWDDPIEGYKNGRDYIIPCLESHQPLDLVIIFLGVNDLKKRFSLSAYDIAEGAGVLVQIVQKSNTGINDTAPHVLLMAPPPVGKLSAFAEMLEGAEVKSQKFAEHYQRVAYELGCTFIDTSTVIVSSDLDGIHFEQSEHAKLGQVLAIKVKEIIG